MVSFCHYVVRFSHYVTRFAGNVLYFHHDVLKSSFDVRSPALLFGFCSTKQLGVFLLPPGWDASPSQA